MRRGAAHARACARIATQGERADDGFAGHDDGDAQCRLYDQLAHADLVVRRAARPGAHAGTGEPAPGALPAGRLAPQAAGFLARGPPLTA